MKPKLLIVTSTFPRWQNDTDPPFVHELAKRLASSFNVLVHTPHHAGALRQETMDGVQVHRFRYFFSRGETFAGGRGIVPKLRTNKLYALLLPFFICSQFCSLLLLVARFKPNIIHAHWLIPQGLFAVIIKQLYGTPVAVTAHGTDVFTMRQPIFLRLKKHIVNNANAIATVSIPLSQMLFSDTMTAPAPIVVPMGVDESLFSPSKRDGTVREKYNIKGPLFLFVGRLTEVKGLCYLIKAMSIVHSEIPDAQLLIIGHGELKSALVKQTNQLSLQKVIHFIGAIPNEQLPKYYAEADLFIGPSIQTNAGEAEGLGLTFIEAAMSGCLLIGTSTGGIEDTIIDGKTGFLVPQKDPQALAQKIKFAAVNMHSLHNMRKLCREEAIKKFSWSRISCDYAKVLKGIVKN